MALGTNHVINADVGAGWVPDIWNDEAIVAFKKKTVMRNLVTVISAEGKKGDVIHIPTFPTHLTSTAKAVETQVTLQSPTNSEVQVNLNRHFEVSFIIEDLTQVQALASLRSVYTDSAGYALARRIDYELHALGTGVQTGTLDTSIGAPEDTVNTLSYDKAVIGSDGSTLWSASANTNTGNGAALTDSGFRKMIQTLDDADIPFEDRALVIPPVERKNIMGIPRFTEQAFRGDGNTLRTGVIGELYGVPVYVSSAAPKIQAADATTNYRVALLLHKSAFVLVEQMSIRFQSQYKLEYLGNLTVADTLFGVAETRDTAAIAFVTPA